MPNVFQGFKEWFIAAFLMQVRLVYRICGGMACSYDDRQSLQT